MFRQIPAFDVPSPCVVC